MRGKVTADAAFGGGDLVGGAKMAAMRGDDNVDDSNCEGKPLRGDGNHLLIIYPRWA